MNIYDFEVKAIDGKIISLAKFKGKVLLIVNTASKCGFTPQYEELQTLYNAYADQGLEILGFPSNQFAEQESGSKPRCKTFASSTMAYVFLCLRKQKCAGRTPIRYLSI